MKQRFTIDQEVLGFCAELCGISVVQWLVDEDGVFRGALVLREDEDAVPEARSRTDQFIREFNASD